MSDVTLQQLKSLLDTLNQCESGIDSLKDENEALLAQVKKLNHEIEGWKSLQGNQAETIGKYQAQVENLRDNASEIVDEYFDYIERYQIDSEDMSSSQKRKYDMMVALNSSLVATPVQCLAEIEVRAATKFGEGIIAHFEGCNYNLTLQTLGWYINEKLRQVAKEKNETINVHTTTPEYDSPCHIAECNTNTGRNYFRIHS